jgi:cytochrome c-type biogenesis protein CcmH/NrfF
LEQQDGWIAVGGGFGFMRSTLVIVLLMLATAGSQLSAQAANQLPPAEDGPMKVHPEAQSAIDQLKSPYCPGLMLEVCPSPGGAALRDSLQNLAVEGWSADEIVEWVIGNHGEQWRALPRRSGASLVLAWIVPPVGVLVGFLLVIVALRRMRAGQGPRPAVTGEVSGEEEARLRAAMRELDAEEEATFF